LPPLFKFPQHVTCELWNGSLQDAMLYEVRKLDAVCDVGAKLQVIESILDDDNDMQDMYLGRRAAVEAALQAHQVCPLPALPVIVLAHKRALIFSRWSAAAMTD
jgi:hypothetical protein